MKSSRVSLKPPLKPLVRGVRMASVMTTSSGFFWVLTRVLNRRRCKRSLVGGDIHCGESALGWRKVAENRIQSLRSHLE